MESLEDNTILPPSLLAQYRCKSIASSLKLIKKTSTLCTIVAGLANGEVLLLDANFSLDQPDIRLIKRIECHNSPITCLDISGTRVISASEEGKVSMFDAVNPNFKQSALLTCQRINTLRFLEAQTIVLGTHSNEIQIWDLQEHIDGSLPMKQFVEYNGRSDVTRSVWSIDYNDNYFVSGTGVGDDSAPPVIMIHDQALKEPYPILVNDTTHRSDIWKVQFLKNGHNILSCDDRSLFVTPVARIMTNEGEQISGLDPSSLLIQSILPLNTFGVDEDNGLILSPSEEEMMYVTKYNTL